MKTTKLLRNSLIAVLLATWFGAITAAAFELPPLDTAAQKLAFLIAVKKKIPKLFSDAAQYDVDLFELLDEEKKLVEHLNSATFKQLFSEKTYINLKISPPLGGLSMGDVEIDPLAIEAWKLSLQDTLDNVKKMYQDPQELVTSLNRNISYWKKLQQDPLKILNAIGHIPKGKGQKKQISTLKIPLEVLKTCKQKPSLREKYECILERYEELIRRDEVISLPNLPGREKIEELIFVVGEKENLIVTTKLALVINTNQQARKASTWEDLKDAINQLTKDDLIFLSDTQDVITPELSKIIQLDRADLIIRNLSDNHSKWISFFANQTTTQQKKVKNDIFLEEVPPLVGIFRGFIGGDCSSQYSFPYPNDPHERVFFVKKIKNGKEKLKGYVSATEVLVNNQKALYVVTISGSKLGAGDTELILRGLDRAKDMLGVRYIVLPQPQKLEKLINFKPIRSVYEKYIKKDKLVSIIYQNEDLRNKIQQFVSSYNSADYDHIKNNTKGSILSFNNNNTLLVQNILAHTSISIKMLHELENNDVFDFLNELKSSNRIPQLNNILNNDELRHNAAIIDFYCKYCKQLTEDLKDWYWPVRWAAVAALGQIKVDNVDIQLNLAEALNDKDWGVRQAAAEAFEEIKPHNISVQLKLAEALNDKDSQVRQAAAKAFKEIKPHNISVQLKLAEALNDEMEWVRQAAAEAFKEIKPHNISVQLKIAEALQHIDADIRRIAVYALGQIKVDNVDIQLKLAEALNDKNERVRQAAAEAFKEIKPHNISVQLKIAEALQHIDADIRRIAVYALGQIKVDNVDIQLKLAEALNDKNEWVRQAAAEAFKEIKPHNISVQLKIAEALQHIDANIRWIAVYVLGQTKVKDLAVLGKLADASKDKDARIRQAAEYVLGQIEAKDKYLAFLLKLADALHKDGDIRQAAIYLLGPIKVEDLTIQLQIAKTLKYEDADIRKAAAKILKKIKPQNGTVQLTIVEALINSDWDVRKNAARLLGAINLENDAIQNKIAEALSNTHWDVRQDAASLLGEIRPTNSEIHLKLALALKDTSWRVRLAAAKALGAINSENSSIKFKLAAALKDENPQVRQAAEEALQ
jgi:HEAT repeat protein